jgi:hypothetical protein
MQEFQHIIITRFNLRNNNWSNRTKNNALILTESWLENRFDLFENFCFLSVRNQSNTNFQWWVFFDTETPIRFRERISDLERRFDRFTALFVDGMDAFLPEVQQGMAAFHTAYIITSRLDNDDCLHRDYVEIVQQQFDHQTYLALDIIDGFTLQVQPEVRLGFRRHLYNPFITLIEENNNPKSVWDRTHSDWKKEKRLKRLKKERLWMSVIHQENKVNEYHGYGTPDFGDTLLDFGIRGAKKSELRERLTHSKRLSLKYWCEAVLYNGFKDLKKSIGLYSYK